MLQPFERLLPMYIDKLEKLGKKYFVTQSYPRGVDILSEDLRIPILVSVYDDLGLAKTHLNALKADKYGAIIHLDKPEHKTKLWEMVKGDTKFAVYWAVVKDASALEKKINLKYKDNMKRYIDRHTNWRISREATVNASVQLVFGELYINLKHGSQHLRIKFEEIEQI